MTAATIIATCLCGCTAAGPGHTGTRSSSPVAIRAIDDDEIEATVTRLQKQVTCEKVVAVESDLSFYDPAAGFDCLRHDGRALIARVYGHSDTVVRAVDEWSPTFGSERTWSRGENWVVFGPVALVSSIAESLDGSAASNATPGVGVEADVAARDACMGFVSSTASDAVTAPARYRSEKKAIDKQYPGASKVVDEVVTPQLRARLHDVADYEQSAALSAFGARFRSVCKSVTFEGP